MQEIKTSIMHIMKYIYNKGTIVQFNHHASGFGGVSSAVALILYVGTDSAVGDSKDISNIEIS